LCDGVAEKLGGQTLELWRRDMAFNKVQGLAANVLQPRDAQGMGVGQQPGGGRVGGEAGGNDETMYG
jgi:hypothetical protein